MSAKEEKLTEALDIALTLLTARANESVDNTDYRNLLMASIKLLDMITINEVTGDLVGVSHIVTAITHLEKIIADKQGC